MKNITVKDILELTNGELIIGSQDFECENFSKDTRQIKENDIYVGIKGEKFDGNLFWKEALEKGAKCVIVENIDFSKEDLEDFRDKIIVEVENTLESLYKIAAYKRKINDIPVVAITGSVGKTSTKDMIASVVSQKYKTLKTIGNNNNNIGLPFTILRLKDEEIMVLEMGMNHFGEISLLSKIAKPNICVITNIGTSHIGNLGSRENILKAKLEILDGAENPIIIINNDNDLLHKWYLENRDNKNIITFGIENESDIMPKNLKLYHNGSEYECNINGENVKVKVPIAGEHFVLNALCATTVGNVLDIKPNKILQGIENVELTKNRMDVVEKNGITIINDAYNASLESITASLKYLLTFKNSRKIAILGDILEVGEYNEELHRKVGKEVVNQKVDILICYGEASKYIVDQARKEGMDEENIYYFEDKNQILDFLKEEIKKGDVLLFKASNGMRFFDLATEIEKFLS